MTPNRRAKYRQTRYPDPKLSTVHQTGASPGVTVLRELEIDDDTILKGLGFRGRTPKAPNASEASKANGRTGPSDEPCSICDFQTDPPHDGRSHQSQTKKKPFTEEELKEKGLTKT
jgi:hypothetical protein